MRAVAEVGDAGEHRPGVDPLDLRPATQHVGDDRAGLSEVRRAGDVGDQTAGADGIQRGREGGRIEAEAAADNTISGQENAAAARASRPTAEAKAEAWELAMVRDDVANETQRSVVLAFQRVGQDDVLAPYVEKYLDAAHTLWEDKGTQRASTALEFMFPKPLASQDLLDRVDAWLESTEANPAAQRYVREGRADVARALAAQATDS